MNTKIHTYKIHTYKSVETVLTAGGEVPCRQVSIAKTDKGWWSLIDAKVQGTPVEVPIKNFQGYSIAGGWYYRNARRIAGRWARYGYWASPYQN